MRIVGGSARGRKIMAPRGRATRPTLDHIREALFNILGARVEGAHVLDLFAGTGAMGIEALSRGAEHCVFVESSPAALKLITSNLKDLDLADRATISSGDVFRQATRLRRRGEIFDIAIAAPPYRLIATDAGEARLLRFMGDLSDSGVLSPEACAVIEQAAAPNWSGAIAAPWTLLDRRRYGGTALTLLVRKKDNTGGSETTSDGEGAERGD